MKKRQIDRLQRHVVPEQIDGRRPHQDAAVADLPFQQRRSTVVEPGDHLRPGSGGDSAVAVEAGSGEITGARRAEDLEHGVTVLERAKARGCAGRTIDGCTGYARKQLTRLRPGRAFAKHNEKTATALHESLQPFAGRLADGHVVEDDHGCGVEIVDRDRIADLVRRLEPRRFAHGQRAGQVQAGVARRRAALGDDDANRRLRRQHEVERVVAQQRVVGKLDGGADVLGSRSLPARTSPTPNHRRRVTRAASESHGRRDLSATVGARGRVAVVGHARRDRHALLVLERSIAATQPA